MQLYKVWSVLKIGDKDEAKKEYLHPWLNEKCLMNGNGDYVGQKTGTVYPKESHYHTKQLEAIIIAVDESNKTGMFHLYGSDDREENARSRKTKYLGCRVTLEDTNFFDDGKVYRCLELQEFFSESEVAIIGNS